MSNPLVSVIMPVYNSDKTIDQAIESILNQTYKNFELIICNDGSLDLTEEKIKEYKDIRIRYYRNDTNRGNLYTTNKLFDLCVGEYIALQDADDFSALDRIQKQIIKISEFNVDLVTTNASILYENTIIKNIENPIQHKDIIDFLHRNKKLTLIWGSVLFKKEVYLDIGGFDPIFDRVGAADINWLLRAIKKYNFFNISESLYIYRQHAESFTKKININDNKFVSRIFSEDIAYDIYEDIEEYSFEKSKNAFNARLFNYSQEFESDNKKLLSVFFSNLIFKQMSFFAFILHVLKLKTKFFLKIVYIMFGLIYLIFGLSFLEKIKEKMR